MCSICSSFLFKGKELVIYYCQRATLTVLCVCLYMNECVCVCVQYVCLNASTYCICLMRVGVH